MQKSTAFLLVRLVLAGGGLCIWLLQAFLSLSAPFLPYQGMDDEGWQIVRGQLDAQRSGSLQLGDEILSINGENVAGCYYYFLDSPLYRTPRNVPVAVTYQRPGSNSPAQTHIILTDRSMQDTLRSIPRYLLALITVLAGIIILMGGVLNVPHLLVGLMLLTLGLMHTSWENPDHIPFAIVAWLSIPINSMLLVLSHAIWPVNQLKRRATWAVIAIAGVISLANVLSYLPGSALFGCYASQEIRDNFENLAYLTYMAESITFLGFLYLLLSAYRLTNSPFSRLQIRAIAWAFGLGLGPEILVELFSPQIWSPLNDAAVVLGGIIPITYLFVFYRGELLVIDRYLNRLVFTFLFFISWAILTSVMVQGILFLQPQLAPAIVAFIVALLSVFAASFVRRRLGMFVDLVLYGVHYDYETVVSHLGESLAGATDEAHFAQVVVRQLPQALSIRDAALWLVQPDGQLHLIEHSSPSQIKEIPSALAQADFPAGRVEVEVYGAPFRVGPDPTPWQAILRLYEDARPVGILLLGTKYRENTYSDRDARTLRTLAGWIAATAANLAHQAEREQAIEREHRLMLALAKNEERLVMGVARELHDRGISALSIVRLMVEQGRSPAIISAGLEQVITNLRELSDHQLSPQGLSQGLPQALDVMVETQRQLGLPVFIEIAPDFMTSGSLSAFISRELFYIAQEAVINAIKHASPSRVQVSLSRSGGGVILQIWNDGRAFDVESMLAGRETHGMGIMQARASLIGGSLTITSIANSGTDVVVVIDSASL